MPFTTDQLIKRERERLRILIREVRHEAARLESYLNDSESGSMYAEQSAVSSATNLGWRAQEVVRSTSILETLTAVKRSEEVTR